MAVISYDIQMPISMARGLIERFHLSVFAIWTVIYLTQLAEFAEGKVCISGFYGQGCQYQCHCSGAIPCDPTSGRCPQGCLPGWSGAACHTENVALNKKAQQRTTNEENGADRAVDWSTDTETCAMTREGYPGSWLVDLGQKYDVNRIFLKSSADRNLRGVRVYVSDTKHLSSSSLCGTVTFHTDQTAVDCELPLTGQFIHVVNTEDQLVLCDVQVYVCSDYRFGKRDCDGTCHCVDRTEICDKVSGHCKSGCEVGWSGNNCQKACNGSFGSGCRNPCGHCRDKAPCDPRTGVCGGGCAAGWRGTTCDLNCVPGSYGRGCVYMCGHCLHVHTSCDPFNGRCARGCKAGWMGPRCSVPCPGGRYGENCAFQCGACRSGTTCDIETGLCPQGCAEGWRSVFCTIECHDGTFGADCSQTCGNCFSGSCNRTSGLCGAHGCQVGWSGRKCNKQCPPGMFGDSCTKECGHCLHGQTCDSESGVCPKGCQGGWTGVACIDICKRGFYGEDCQIACGVCMEDMACHHVTGKCPGECAHGYSGPLCQKKVLIDPTKNLLLSVVLVTGTIVFGSLLAFIVCMVTRWRQDDIQDDGEQDEKREERRTPLLKRLDSG